VQPGGGHHPSSSGQMGGDALPLLFVQQRVVRPSRTSNKILRLTSSPVAGKFVSLILLRLILETDTKEREKEKDRVEEGNIVTPHL